MLPVLGRELVEGQQRIAILDQALDSLVVLDAPGFDEGVEGEQRILPGLGHPDLLECPFGFRLLAPRQPVQDVGGLMHPAALAAGLRPHFLDRLPEAECAVGDRELGPHREPAPLHVEEEFPPGLPALARTVDEADQLLLAFRRGADDDQQALRGILEPGLHMDAVDPAVDVAFGREIALAPARVLLRPGFLEAPDGGGREPGRVLAEQRNQRLLELTGGDAFEVEDRDQHVEALRSTSIGRQNRRGKANALGPSPTRSRSRGQRTATGPMPVMISRSGRCPWRTSRWRPSLVSLSAWQLSKAATSASTACANSTQAPLRKTSVSESAKLPGWESGKTLVSVTAYHSFSGEVEASSTPTIRRLTPSCRHQLSSIAQGRCLGACVQKPDR